MKLFSLEHSVWAYRLDAALYGGGSIMLAGYLLVAAPDSQQLVLAAFTLLGLTSWTMIEYFLHRFILHGLAPFKIWHAKHHHRPTALICTPTVLSASLIGMLIFLPAWVISDLWRSSAFTLGILLGYLIYTLTHHGVHHWRTDNTWLKRRKHWHALHHRNAHLLSADQTATTGHFGVTTAFWDYVFSQPLIKR